MNRKALLLDFILLALAAVLAWQIRVRWLEGQARERAIFTAAARKMAVLAPPPIAPLKPVTGGEYIDVAQKMLFAKDRNPNVPIEPPAPPPVKPPLPALPAYYGQMAFGEPVVLLATNGGPQRSYHVGDKVGPFQVASFDLEKIVLNWNGETVERKIEDLKPKEIVTPAAQPAAARAAAPSAPGSGGAVRSIASPDAASSGDKGPLGGVDVGGGIRSCTPGDTTPAGSQVNGYKKVISRGMFGDVCRWEQVK
jgi:hypothetical protein